MKNLSSSALLCLLLVLTGTGTATAQTLNYLETYDPIGVGTVPVYNLPLAGLHVQHTRFDIHEGARDFRGTVLFNGDDNDPLGTHGGMNPSYLDPIPLTTTGVRWMWIPDQAAVRSGYSETQYWDDINKIGLCSYAHGYNADAGQMASIALGYGARVHRGILGSGQGSFAIGYDTMCTLGQVTTTIIPDKLLQLAAAMTTASLLLTTYPAR
jgi:hypothetical protein